MTVSEVIEHLKQFEKVYGKNMPVAVIVDGVLYEVDGVWVDPYFDVATIKGGKES
ncbi:TPA: hypothetical protein ACF3PP_000050 [Enterococcus faecium]|jgi:hypothetical protein